VGEPIPHRSSPHFLLSYCPRRPSSPIFCFLSMLHTPGLDGCAQRRIAGHMGAVASRRAAALPRQVSCSLPPSPVPNHHITKSTPACTMARTIATATPDTANIIRRDGGCDASLLLSSSSSSSSPLFPPPGGGHFHQFICTDHAYPSQRILSHCPPITVPFPITLTFRSPPSSSPPPPLTLGCRFFCCWAPPHICYPDAAASAKTLCDTRIR